MNDVCRYEIRIAGRTDENDLNTLSPLEMQVVRIEVASTWLYVLTDQSGLIGLMRHLHGLGFVFLSVSRVERV